MNSENNEPYTLGDIIRNEMQRRKECKGIITQPTEVPARVTGAQWMDEMYIAIEGNDSAVLLMGTLLEAIPDFKHINATHVVVPNEDNMTEAMEDSTRMLFMCSEGNAPDKPPLSSTQILAGKFALEVSILPSGPGALSYTRHIRMRWDGGSMAINRHELPSDLQVLFRKDAIRITWVGMDKFNVDLSLKAPYIDTVKVDAKLVPVSP